jgi:hypothetical protein
MLYYKLSCTPSLAFHLPGEILHKPDLDQVSSSTPKMLFTTLTTLALAATGLAQVAVPEGYRKVYITSKQDTKYVIVPKSRTNGSTLVV